MACTSPYRQHNYASKFLSLVHSQNIWNTHHNRHCAAITAALHVAAVSRPPNCYYVTPGLTACCITLHTYAHIPRSSSGTDLYLRKTFVVKTMYNYNLLCYISEMLNITTPRTHRHTDTQTHTQTHTHTHTHTHTYSNWCDHSQKKWHTSTYVGKK